jgi:hypothetical protein
MRFGHVMLCMLLVVASPCSPACGHDRRVSLERKEDRVVDHTITFTASNGPLIFGATKEGTMAVRVHDALRVAGGTGQYRNSAGDRDGAVWGRTDRQSIVRAAAPATAGRSRAAVACGQGRPGTVPVPRDSCGKNPPVPPREPFSGPGRLTDRGSHCLPVPFRGVS